MSNNLLAVKPLVTQLKPELDVAQPHLVGVTTGLESERASSSFYN